MLKQPSPHTKKELRPLLCLPAAPVTVLSSYICLHCFWFTCLRLHKPLLVSLGPPAEPGHLSCCVCCTHVWICLTAHMPAALPPCQQYLPEYCGVLYDILQTCPVSIVYSMYYVQMFHNIPFRI